MGWISLQQITFSIDEQHPSLAGHFPGNPVIPAVVLLGELLAGVTAIRPNLRVQGIKQVKFLRPVLPGDEVRVHLKSTQMESIGFQAYRDEDMVFGGELYCEATS